MKTNFLSLKEALSKPFRYLARGKQEIRNKGFTVSLFSTNALFVSHIQ